MASIRAQNLAKQQEVEAAVKAKRLQFANDPDGVAGTGKLSKKESRNAVNGGNTVNNYSIGPYGGQPDSSVDEFPVAPDYYRDGYLETKTVTDEFTQQVRTFQVWDPIPGLVGERKEPTLSSIKLVDVSKIKNPNADSENQLSLIPKYTKFFLDSVQESEQEKVQIVETFSDYYSFFYGKKPPVYNFSGFLLNFINYNWLNEFMYLYENFWRGTKAVERKARIFLTYNYQQVQGYILNVNTNLNATTDKGAPFSISMLVTKRLIFSPSEDYTSDSLIPRSDTGLINTQADPYSKTLTTDYLKAAIPADGNETLDGSNRQDGNRTFKESLDSSTKDSFGSFKKISGLSRGASNASSLKAGFGFA